MATLSRRTGLTGAAGEYYVAAELSRRGWLATVTIKNAPGTDVLAQNLESGRVIAVQTKTASPKNMFQLSAKDERVNNADNEWYALVSLKDLDTRPTFFLVPRNVAAAIVYATHRIWLSEPGRGGRVRRDSSMRQIFPAHVPTYREAWDNLALPTSRVPVDLPADVRDWIERDAAAPYARVLAREPL